MGSEYMDTTVKLEDSSENVTEIQSYLAGFQKEIGDSNLPSGTEDGDLRALSIDVNPMPQMVIAISVKSHHRESPV
ncbi:hypothetical protein HUJ04_008586 [Dendroctonus ponderosae]|nr:hypothetical protein HUJ04_008586 [Dendroctonus ponderosae]